MIQTTCRTIEQRLTLKEELNADQQKHVQDCDACGIAAELPCALASALRPSDPAEGFSARLRADVQSRLSAHRRLWPAVAAVSALAVVALFLFVSTTLDSPQRGESDMRLPAKPRPLAQLEPTTINDIQLAEELASLAKPKNFTEKFADWDMYEEPIIGVAILAILLGE